jgi:hypothetical protein
MTFESSIKIFDAAITKIFDFANMVFDSADMVFDAAVDMVFDAAANMVFDAAIKIFRKFDPGIPRNSTPASQEIQPLRLKSFDPCV